MNRRRMYMGITVMLLLGLLSTSSLAAKRKSPEGNLALNKPVVVSSEVDANNPARAVTDGLFRSRWIFKGKEDRAWVYIDLGKPTEFNKVVILSDKLGVGAYQIQVSNDANSWTDVYIGRDLPENMTINIDKQTARYLRLNITGVTIGESKSMSIAEMKVYLNASSNGEENIEEDPEEDPERAPERAKSVPADYNPTADIEQLKNGMVLMLGNNTGYVNGKYKRIDSDNFMVIPQVVDGVTLVPITKFITEGFGVTVNWDYATKTATISKGGKNFSITINSDIMKTSNGDVRLNVPAQIINGRIMLPLSALRVLSEAMGKKVVWSKSGIIVICENDAAFGEKTDAGRNANYAAKVVITQADNNIVTVVPHHPSMAIKYGKPAIIPPGGDYPAIDVTPHYPFSLTTDVVFEDGSIVQSLGVQNLTAEKKLTLTFKGKPRKVGTYQIRMTFSKKGLDHCYSVYFTIVNPAKFTNGIVAEAYIGDNGKLKYTPDFMGNHLIDFSTAGYMGGGVALPVVTVVKTVKPTGGDDTKILQAAIDKVSTMPLNGKGIRGAILLDVGEYTISKPLSIAASGVVLRGSGSGKGRTLVNFTNGAGIQAEGLGAFKNTTTVNAMDLYIPSGSDRIRVQDASVFNVGDMVRINRVVTPKWVKYVNMDNLSREGNRMTWIAPGMVHEAIRKVKKISGKTLILDGSLVDSYDSETLGFPVATVSKGDYGQSRLSQIGFEKFRIKIVPAQGPAPLTMDKIENSWVNDLYVIDGKSSVKLGGQSFHITVNNVEAVHLVGNIQAGPPADFAMNGANNLMSNVRSQVEGANQWSVVTHAGSTGPLVVINSRIKMSPHMRWTIGILADNCVWPSDAGSFPLGFINRGRAGSGHGWTTAWSVAWNFATTTYANYAAPGTANYVIGGGPGNVDLSKDPTKPQGVYEAFGTRVSPPSLYLQQLKDRIGVGKLPY